MAADRWIMQGLNADDPGCIKTVSDLENFIEKLGFLPLFRSDIPGFSVEEHVASDSWWTGDAETDPWEWRKTIASHHRIAYGKFFDRKAGFISKDWFPVFANYRRDGYDFDARWDDELASLRSKKIMDLFAEEKIDRELFAHEIKQESGLSKEKNFDGEITNLQMLSYLCIGNFKRKLSKSGNEYGWGVAVYCTPEHLWGYDHVTSCYSEEPAASAAKLEARLQELYPEASAGQISRFLGIKTSDTTRKTVLSYPDNLIKALKIEGLSPGTLTEDQKAGLEVAIGQLRSKHARLIGMKYREGMTYEQIGTEMLRSPGTVSGYNSKALSKLRWPEIAEWYINGFRKTVGKYYPEEATGFSPIPDNEPCLVIGLSFKQYDVLKKNGIRNVADLLAAMENPNWFKPLNGIGAKTSVDIKVKLQRYVADNQIKL